MLILSFICANSWAAEQNFKSPLDYRISVYGGAELYNANGEFSSTKEGRPDIDLELDDLDLEDKEKFIGEGHASVLAPLPNLFLGGAFAVTEKFIARLGGGWMSLSSGDYDGRLLAADVHLEYWPFKYAGLGAGYRYITIDFDYDDGEKEEEYNLSIPGPLLYVIFGF